MISNTSSRAITFLKDILKHRDESHGIEHALAVKDNAMTILTNTVGLDTGYEKIIELSALFHDVCDHKYAHDVIDEHLSLKLEQFLHSEEDRIGEKNLAKNVSEVIKEISYSRELMALNKNEPPPWTKLPSHLQFCRNVVSDADKLEALGLVGIERCLQYQKEINPFGTQQEINKKALFHMKDKLINLPKFMNTQYGKCLVISQHQIMIDWIIRNDDFEEE
jgi:uncharacterized protein